VATSLRSFRASDRAAVLGLSSHALTRPEEHVGNPVWSTEDEMEEEIADWDPPAEETLLVIEEDKKVVAFGGVEFPIGFEHAELFGPLVDRQFHGQKLGARLLTASIELGRERGASSVRAAIGTSNTGGLLLLERFEFRARGGALATYRLSPVEHRAITEGPPGVEVRRGTADDLEAALALYRECFPQGDFPESVWRAEIAAGSVYVAEVDGRPAAVLNIDSGDHWIYHVAVTESERKRGVGAYLLSRSLEDYWSTHPERKLGLDVAADNIAAIRLYRRQGFLPWLVLQPFALAL
jgi:ribosomal protein S18 acetylase RimI-like enzyme